MSPGKVEGTLVDFDSMDLYDDAILYTKMLSPDLIQFFDRFKGIVSESGGMLSHLSIIARERKMPVVTNFKLGKRKLGQKIKMDGESGSVK